MIYFIFCNVGQEILLSSDNFTVNVLQFIIFISNSITNILNLIE